MAARKAGRRPTPEELRARIAALNAESERLRSTRVDPSADNMLKITAEGRQATLRDAPGRYVRRGAR